MENIEKEFLEKAGTYITGSTNIVVLSHKNPDGDALGSGLALYSLFEGMDKGVRFIVPNKLPANMDWMPGYSDILVYEDNKEQGAEIIGVADLIIMVDFNHRSRLSEVADKVLPSKARKIMIDHHPYPEQIADIIYSRVSACSTAEMVFEFIDGLFGRDTITQVVAESLFTGILTDTGSFSYNSSNPFTYKVVSALLEKGVDKDAITDKVFNNYSEYRMRLLGYAISRKMKVIPEYKAAYISLSKKELEEFHFEPGDIEGFVNYPLSIRGVVFTALFTEKDNFTKCSFRSRGAFPANKVAETYFKGGGHKNAAGGESNLSLEETCKLFEKILPEYEKFL